MLKAHKLSFTKGNAKLAKHTASFSLPAGHSCPFASYCLAKADRNTGKLTAGPCAQIRCYAAMGEVLFRNIRRSRWHNFDLLRKCNKAANMANLIDWSIIRKGVRLVRIHSSGDFFSQKYFDAWLIVAKRNPQLTFYAYTKAIPYWVARLGDIPTNLKLVASLGGKRDRLAKAHGLRTVRVVWTEAQATRLKLPIDHDDTHAWQHTGNFAVLLHNIQPAGTPAAKAWHKIKTKGRGGYRSDYFAHYKK